MPGPTLRSTLSVRCQLLSRSRSVSWRPLPRVYPIGIEREGFRTNVVRFRSSLHESVRSTLQDEQATTSPALPACSAIATPRSVSSDDRSQLVSSRHQDDSQTWFGVSLEVSDG